jgi:hypothetical protein
VIIASIPDKRMLRRTPHTNDCTAQLESVALEEQHDFESLPKERRETQQCHSPHHPEFAALLSFILQQFSLALVMNRNPAGPINSVKEPVHDQEENEDCE